MARDGGGEAAVEGVGVRIASGEYHPHVPDRRGDRHGGYDVEQDLGARVKERNDRGDEEHDQTDLRQGGDPAARPRRRRCGVSELS